MTLLGKLEYEHDRYALRVSIQDETSQQAQVVFAHGLLEDLLGMPVPAYRALDKNRRNEVPYASPRAGGASASVLTRRARATACRTRP